MTQQELDILYMKRCLQLAANGLGYVRPNPMVGCVVVKEGQILAEGYHQRYGENHAERNALLSLSGDAARGATLYVNLEPCSHYGKTPPCADLIVERGISRVVCCNDDPNPLVAGRGFAKLEAAGITVLRHVMEKEGRDLNRRFFTFMEQRRPYVILKWAQSADGYMAPATQGPYWISNGQQTLVSHRLRTTEAAILVGSQTYLDDHPRLSARLLCGPQPLPVVVDRRGRLHDVPSHWLHLHCATPADVLSELYDRKIQSLIVEGGRQMLDAFIAEGLYDEVFIFEGAGLLGDGLPAPPVPPIAPERLHLI